MFHSKDKGKDKEDVYAELVGDLYDNTIISEKHLIELQVGTMKKAKKKMIMSFNHLFYLKLNSSPNGVFKTND